MERDPWRFRVREDLEDSWKIYGFHYLQAGDRPAETLKTISMEKSAETYLQVTKDLNISKAEVKEDS